MTEQEAQGEMPTNPAGETPAEPTQTEAPVTLAEVQAQLAIMQKALKDANREAADRRKKLEAYETAEKQRQEAEMSETDKLKRALEEREAELNRLQLDNLKRAIAQETGLPPALATRLQGSTEDELKADAKALLETIPKAAPNAPKLGATNPGGGASGGETEAQRRARIWSPGGGMFDPNAVRQQGGGVFTVNKSED